MSSTSNKSNRFTEEQGYRSKDHMKIHNNYSSDRYKIGEGRRQVPPKKWSNEKVIDELSTFIAEFSYLTDIPSKHVEDQNIPSQSYQLYPANTGTTNASAFKKDKKLVSFERNNKKNKNKSVEWRNIRRDSIDRKEQAINITETPNSTYGEETIHPSIKENHSKIHHRKFEKYSNRGQSREMSGRKCSRSRSRTKKHTTKNRKSRNRPKRSKSNHSGFKIIPLKPRHRSRSKKSMIKCMPFKYEQKRKKRHSKERQVIIKRRTPIPVVHKVEIKELVASDTPTLITLYPNNTKPKYKKIHEPQFLADPALPCKCFKCMRKYESLINLSPESNGFRDSYNSTYPKSFPHRQKVDYHPHQNVDPYWCCIERKDVVRRRINVHPVNHEFNLDNNCGKSIYFKFNRFVQPIDSNITQYFHSILNNTICN